MKPSKDKKEKIGIIGLGYVGGAVRHWFEERGYQVYLYDKYKNIGSPKEVNRADLVFFCVPTPFHEQGLGYDDSAVQESFLNLPGKKIVVIKSTVLPGSCEKFQKKFPNHKILFNPEFLVAKTAVQDFLKPQRQIIGYTEKSKDAAQTVLDILPVAKFSKIIPATEAEMVKYFGNTFLANRVIFANQMYDVCEKLGIDYQTVKECAAADHRIGPHHFDVFSDGYRGYGGACLSGDEYVFAATDNGIKVQQIRDFNETHILSYDTSSSRIFMDMVLGKAERIVSEAIRIHCTKGKVLTMSLDHLAVVKDEAGGLNIKRADELEVGECFPVAIGESIGQRINFQYQNIYFANGIENEVLVQKLNQSYAEILKPYLTFHQYKDFRRARHHAIPLSACILAGISTENLRIKSGRGATVVPANIVIDENFGRLIGYYLAEGHTGDGRVCLSLGYHEEDLIGDVRNILKSLDIRWSERVNNWKGKASSLTFKISSKILSSWFSQWGKDCYSKEVPPPLFFSRQSVKDAFLSGLFRGDGHIEHSNKGDYCTVVYATVSRKLHEGVDLLLREKGIIASRRSQMGLKSTVPAFWLRISEMENTRKLLPLFTERQIKHINHFGRPIKSPAYELLPQRNIGFIKIRKIEKILKPHKVFALETTSGIYLTSGGIITHNCLPKDTKAFIQLAESINVDPKLLKTVETINKELLNDNEVKREEDKA